MASWASKDPDAVLDYRYTVPLDEGDTLDTATLTRIDGTVNIDSQSVAGADLTAWLSGGADGEIAIFRVAWTTAAGRTNDDVITLPVTESDLEPLLLTGYMKPAAGHLVARYPAFAAVPLSTIQYWLTDAERSVDTSWGEGDYAAALMALAAHNMSAAGLGTDNSSLAGVPAGITAMKSGSLALNFTPEAANARLTGDFTATRYGQEYQMLLRRNRGGPIVSDTGQVETLGWPVYPLGWL